MSEVEYDENDVDEGYSETTSTSCEVIDDDFEHCETSTETYDEVGTPTDQSVGDALNEMVYLVSTG